MKQPTVDDVVRHLKGERGPLHDLIDEMVEAGVKKALAARKPAAWVRWDWNRSGIATLVFDKPDQPSLSDEARGVVYDPLYF